MRCVAFAPGRFGARAGAVVQVEDLEAGGGEEVPQFLGEQQPPCGVLLLGRRAVVGLPGPAAAQELGLVVDRQGGAGGVRGAAPVEGGGARPVEEFGVAEEEGAVAQLGDEQSAGGEVAARQEARSSLVWQ